MVRPGSPQVVRPGSPRTQPAGRAEFIRAKIAQYHDGKRRVDRSITLTNAKQVGKLASFFPGLGKGRRSPVAAGWEAAVVIHFTRRDKTTHKVTVSWPFDSWSEGHGDFRMRRGGLAAFVNGLFATQPTTQPAGTKAVEDLPADVREAMKGLKARKPIERARAAARLAAASVRSAVVDKRILDALIPLLRDKDPFVRKAAARALGKIGHARAVKPLVALLGDRVPRSTVVQSLGQICHPSAWKPLRAAADSSVDPGFRRKVALSLSEIAQANLEAVFPKVHKVDLAAVDINVPFRNMQPHRTALTVQEGDAILFLLRERGRMTGAWLEPRSSRWGRDPARVADHGPLKPLLRQRPRGEYRLFEAVEPGTEMMDIFYVGGRIPRDLRPAIVVQVNIRPLTGGRAAAKTKRRARERLMIAALGKVRAGERDFVSKLHSLRQIIRRDPATRRQKLAKQTFEALGPEMLAWLKANPGVYSFDVLLGCGEAGVKAAIPILRGYVDRPAGVHKNILRCSRISLAAMEGKKPDDGGHIHWTDKWKKMANALYPPVPKASAGKPGKGPRGRPGRPGARGPAEKPDPVPHAPPTRPAAGTAKMGLLGPTIERVVLDASGRVDCCIDLDTGVLLTPPHWFNESGHASYFTEFQRRMGVDALARVESVRGLTISDTRAVLVKNAVWKSERLPRRILDEVRAAAPGRPGLSLGKDGKPATYVLVTREGGTGVVQVLGVTDKPRGVKIRYRMVRGTVKTDKTTPWGEAFNGLQCRLLPPVQVVEPSSGKSADIGAYVTYEIRNVSDRTMMFLPHFTPLEGVRGRGLRVVGPDGKDAMYRGGRWRRGSSRPRDYLAVHKSQTLSARVGLLYDLTRPGLYKITSQIRHGPGVARGFYARDAAKARRRNPDNVWSGKLVSNTVTLKVVRGKTPWGDSDKKRYWGFAARLRVEKRIWNADKVPVLRADLRNRGGVGLFFVPAATPPEINIDGKWYTWGGTGKFPAESYPLGPGRVCRGIRIRLDKNWKHAKTRAPLALSPGKHTIRARFVAEWTDHGKRSLDRKRSLDPAVSNTITIEVLPGKTKQPAAQPKTKAATVGLVVDEPKAHD